MPRSAATNLGKPRSSLSKSNSASKREKELKKVKPRHRSRTGCHTCRGRKVKCDERGRTPANVQSGRPLDPHEGCLRCQRSQHPCGGYSDPQPVVRRKGPRSRKPADDPSAGPPLNADGGAPGPSASTSPERPPALVVSSESASNQTAPSDRRRRKASKKTLGRLPVLAAESQLPPMSESTSTCRPSWVPVPPAPQHGGRMPQSLPPDDLLPLSSAGLQPWYEPSPRRVNPPVAVARSLSAQVDNVADDAETASTPSSPHSCPSSASSYGGDDDADSELGEAGTDSTATLVFTSTEPISLPYVQPKKIVSAIVVPSPPSNALPPCLDTEQCLIASTHPVHAPFVKSTGEYASPYSYAPNFASPLAVAAAYADQPRQPACFGSYDIVVPEVVPTRQVSWPELSISSALVSFIDENAGSHQQPVPANDLAPSASAASYPFRSSSLEATLATSWVPTTWSVPDTPELTGTVQPDATSWMVSASIHAAATDRPSLAPCSLPDILVDDQDGSSFTAEASVDPGTPTAVEWSAAFQ